MNSLTLLVEEMAMNNKQIDLLTERNKTISSVLSQIDELCNGRGPVSEPKPVRAVKRMSNGHGRSWDMNTDSGRLMTLMMDGQPRTSNEMAAATGLPAKRTASYAHIWTKRDKLKRVGGPGRGKKWQLKYFRGNGKIRTMPLTVEAPIVKIPHTTDYNRTETVKAMMKDGYARTVKQIADALPEHVSEKLIKRISTIVYRMGKSGEAVKRGDGTWVVSGNPAGMTQPTSTTSVGTANIGHDTRVTQVVQ